MRVLLDECVHKRVARYLPGHEVKTVYEAGWDGVKNGELLRRASAAFDVLVTMDKNMQYQHDERTLPLPIITIVTKRGRWVDLAPVVPMLNDLLSGMLERQFYRLP